MRKHLNAIKNVAGCKKGWEERRGTKLETRDERQMTLGESYRIETRDSIGGSGRPGGSGGWTKAGSNSTCN